MYDWVIRVIKPEGLRFVTQFRCNGCGMHQLLILTQEPPDTMANIDLRIADDVYHDAAAPCARGKPYMAGRALPEVLGKTLANESGPRPCRACLGAYVDGYLGVAR